MADSSGADDRLGRARGNARRELDANSQHGVKGVESADERLACETQAVVDGRGHGSRVMDVVVGTGERAAGDCKAALHYREVAHNGSGLGGGDRSAGRIEMLHGSERPGVDR